MVKEGGGYRNTPAKSSPYDVSNSFVRRLASRVSGLFSQSTSNTENDKTEPTIRNTSISEENHVISPITEDTLQIIKRRRLRSLEDSHTVTRSRDGGISISFSTSSAVDSERPGPSGYQRTHMVSSTPATMLTGLKLIRDNIAKQSTSPDIEVYEDACSQSSESTSGYTPSVPQSNFPNRSSQFRRANTSLSGGTSGVLRYDVDVHQRSTISNRDSQSQSQLPTNNLNSSSISNRDDSIHITSLNKHEPSFNPSIISTSNTRKQLSSSLTSLSSSSLSIGNHSNRSLTTQSPFYCNRTMYGGAATFSRNKQSNIFNKTNIFSLPKKMNVKPISNKPETTSTDTNAGMSAAARRILETINSYSSPIMDAKRIPVNEPSSSSSSANTNKRKRTALTANLDETVPSMPDLLTIKRREMMNKSTCEARSASLNATKSTSTSTMRYSPGLSDISSDETDDDIQPPARIESNLDNRSHANKITTKITRRRGKTDFDDRPVEDVNLPNAVLEITELPNFTANISSKNNRNVTKCKSDNFSFAKPLMESATEVGNLIKSKNNLCGSPKSKRNEVPNFENRQVKSNENSGFAAVAVTVPKKIKWKCEECWVMNDETESKCVACGGSKIKTNLPVKETWKCGTCWVMNENIDTSCKACTTSKVTDAPKPILKPTVDKWKCEECWITNEKDHVKCVACGTMKPGAVEKKETQFSLGISQSKIEKKPETPKFNFGIPSCSSLSSQEKPSFSKITTSEFKFGVNNSIAPEPAGNSLGFKFGNDASENSFKPQDTTKENKSDSVKVNEVEEKKSNESGFKFGFDTKLKETSSENSLLKFNQNSKPKEEKTEMFKFGSNSTINFPSVSNPPLTFGSNSLVKDTNSDNSLIKFGASTEPKNMNLKNSTIEVNSNGGEPSVSNSIFKFGGSSTTNEINSNSSTFKFGSNFASKETNSDASLFKFGSNSSTGGFTFGKSEEDKKQTFDAATPSKTLDMFKPRLNDFGSTSNSVETIKTPSIGMKRSKSPSPIPAKKRPSITEEPKVNGDLKDVPDTGMETVSPKWSTNSNSLFPIKSESNTNVFGSFQQPSSSEAGGSGGFTFKPTTQPFTFGSATTMPSFNFGPSCAFPDANKTPITNMFNTTPGTGTSFASPFNSNTNSTVDGPLKQESDDQSNKPVFPACNQQPTFGANTNTNFSQPQTGFNPVLPMSFNFSAGTAPRAFTAQPIPTVGTHTAPGIAQRRIRKAVRRSQMK